jgi:hypothetical protein
MDREPTDTVADDGSIHLVVARYREDISWLAQTGFPALVYDKSEDGRDATVIPAGSSAPSQIRVASLPNIGRESHTYLHHILCHYPDFPDYTVFLQGAPFFHMEEDTTPQGLARMILNLAARNVRFKGLAYYRIRCDRLGNPHHLRDPQHRGKWAGWGQDIPVGEVYARLFAGKVPESFNTRAPAGLFMVSRQRILDRPYGLYLRAMDMVLNDPHDEHNTGHALERLWYIIFNGYKKLNRTDYERTTNKLQCRRKTPEEMP